MSAHDQRPPEAPSTREELLSYSKRLEGVTLRSSFVREGIPLTRADGTPWRIRRRNKDSSGGGKGGFGVAVQEGYFGLAQDNRAAPDFEQLGIELKTTGLRPVGDGYSPKEALKICSIRFEDLIGQSFEESWFYQKTRDLLIICYEYDGDVEDPLDFRVVRVVSWGLAMADPRLVAELRREYGVIQEKVRSGHAHELSRGDTLLLMAMTSGSGKLRRQPVTTISPVAKERSFGLKHALLRRIIEGQEHSLAAVADSEERVLGLLAELKGKSVREIEKRVGKCYAENYYSVASRVVELSMPQDVREFLGEAGVLVRNVRLNANGIPEEHVSFPAFSATELEEEESWTDSDFRARLECRVLWVVWRSGETLKDSVLSGAGFWTLPQEDLDGEVRRCWEGAKAAVAACDAKLFPSASESPVAHVRPHGKDGTDVDRFSDGTEFTKQSFWLHKRYVAAAVATILQGT